MRYSFYNFARSIAAIVTGAMLFAYVHGSATDATRDRMVADWRERSHALFVEREALQRNRVDLLAKLREAVNDHLADTRFMSPLHCAIISVEDHRAFESEALLFSVIDYRLSTQSLPVGMDVPGEYFFPAARALTGLRVAPEDVLDQLRDAEDEGRRILLTWVLLQRAGSPTLARQILEPAKRNDNIMSALRLLEAPSDLLMRALEATNKNEPSG